jgi:hypothetical protein
VAPRSVCTWSSCPANAPELAPAEGIWNSLKRVELATLCCPDLPALGLALWRVNERLRHSRHVLRACVTQCGYHV